MQGSNPANRLAAVYGAVGVPASVDAAEMRRLVTEYLPIVKSEVSRFKLRLPAHVEAEELHGVAIGGLMRALERGKDVDTEKFGAYVRQRVRGAILDELRRMDVFSRTVRRKARRYDAAVRAVEQRLGRGATDSEVRVELAMSQEEFAHLLEELRPITFLSLDEPVSGDSGGSFLAERIDDPNDQLTPSVVEARELLKLVTGRLKMLPKMHQKILHMYYFQDFSLAEIGKIFDLSESRISQIHTQAIRGLRTYMQRMTEH